MINLSPFRAGYAWRNAMADATEIAMTWSGEGIFCTMQDTQRQIWRARVEQPWRAQAKNDVGTLLGWLGMAMELASHAPDHEALAALVYMRNPYDDVFDRHRVMGLRDDAGRLSSVRKRSELNTQKSGFGARARAVGRANGAKSNLEIKDST